MLLLLVVTGMEVAMRKLKLTPPRLAFVVITRAALGAGVGLLASSRLTARARRTVGLALVGLGILTTIPAARSVLAAR